MNKSKSNNGITLIVLIITVILLTIVAGVAVKLLIDDDVFGKTEDTVDKANQKTLRENELTTNMLTDWSNSEEGVKVINENSDKIPTSYTVIHEYYTNGTKVGSVSSNISNVYVGDTVDGYSIGKLTSYLNNTYTFTTINPNSLVLRENNSENVITLRYDRTSTNTDGPSPVAP